MSTNDDQPPIAENLRKLSRLNALMLALALASLGILLASILCLYHFPK